MLPLLTFAGFAVCGSLRSRLVLLSVAFVLVFNARRIRARARRAHFEPAKLLLFFDITKFSPRKPYFFLFFVFANRFLSVPLGNRLIFKNQHPFFGIFMIFAFFLHFFDQKFGHIEKKQYLCSAKSVFCPDEGDVLTEADILRGIYPTSLDSFRTWKIRELLSSRRVIGSIPLSRLMVDEESPYLCGYAHRYVLTRI